MSTATAPAAVDAELEPAECTECGRPLKRPSADGLGPVCRRKARATRARRAAGTRYRVTYARVGRHGGRNGTPPPGQLTLTAADADDLAEQVSRDARRYLASSEVEVEVDLDAGTGQILAGFRNAGTFTLEQLPAEEAAQ
ncbi:hypothetical protein RI578_22810 [Streptomyces sp. BB1-1-1]|uniref:hypothetical protein n=1 Tax=Streptomyces sp. BB1-1-1 TaxID=3074430 RepID=UPI0028780F14|nr:hypothetical protein [Streptomyces sp. BB1-1-1]WND36942.1 hypothetical protein RI578_22810 [Streptomyces sp. BB1-1-1]